MLSGEPRFNGVYLGNHLNNCKDEEYVTNLERHKSIGNYLIEPR